MIISFDVINYQSNMQKLYQTSLSINNILLRYGGLSKYLSEYLEGIEYRFVFDSKKTYKSGDYFKYDLVYEYHYLMILEAEIKYSSSVIL